MNVTDPILRVSVVLSHLHQDHIGGLAELSQADIIVSQAEWDTLSSPLPEMRGLMRRHIDLPGLRWHRIEPELIGDPGLAPFRAGHDLFGDGSRRRLREATAMINTMRQRDPGLAILPAHDPGAASRLAQATGQAPRVATT